MHFSFSSLISFKLFVKLFISALGGTFLAKYFHFQHHLEKKNTNLSRRDTKKEMANLSIFHINCFRKVVNIFLRQTISNKDSVARREQEDIFVITAKNAPRDELSVC